MPPQITSHQPVSQPDWSQFSFVDDHQSSSQPDNGSGSHGNTVLSQSTTSYSMHNIKDTTRSKSAAAAHFHAPSHQHISPENSNALHASHFHADPGGAEDFSFADYLTPEFSSENHYSEQSNHTTPSVDELWSHDNQQDGISVSHESDSFALGNGHSGTGQAQSFHNPHFMPVSGHTALLTPEMSTASLTPERTFHPNHTNGLSVDAYDQRQSRNTTSVPYNQNQMNLYSRPTHSPSPSEGRQSTTSGRPMLPAISPVVMVSTYNRGDSPARPQIPLSRSNSKRSQSSRLGDLSDPNAAPGPQLSRLMPPVTLDEQWIDNDQENDEDEEQEHAGRFGVAPSSRVAMQLIPSINDMDKQRELDSTRAEVEHWLAHSEAGTPTGQEPDRSRKSRQNANRIRSRSTGTHLDALGMPIFSDKHIPGPGLLIDEGSEYHYSDDLSTAGSGAGGDESRPESPAAHANIVDAEEPDSYFPDVDDEIAPDELEPLPRQFYRRTPWQDAVRGPGISTDKDQPPTSNAAMHLYENQAARFETASRAATWGTRRRLSDGDINSILDGSQMTRHLSLKETLANKARARGSSILHSAKNMLPRRSNSFVKKHHKQASGQSSGQASPVEEEERVTSPGTHGPRASLSSIHTGRRRSSFTKNKAPKSPPVGSTGGALLAMTGQLTAVGGSSVTVSQAPDTEPLKSPLLGALKRVRSRSDVAKSPKAHHNGGLSGLFKTHGGPPVPTLASPKPMRDAHAAANQGAAADDDDDDDAGDDETGIKMELPMQEISIVPTLEGFKTHARQLNPRLELYLVERIAHDQLKRYKKLVKNRVDHTRLVQLKQQCPSGAHCLDLGGKATILPPRTGSKDSGGNYAQFKVASGGDSDNEEISGDVEGVVTPALFPPGIPLPPTTHLPAEFECPLCFTVKKFQKPSDWTKHVHEDVQPFSCTFPNCPEPKSFKRKADWVRHENERHRHLEWWKCNVQECAHVCYRKDNFVQHLVREHKMTEPKGKGQKSGTRARPASRTTHPGQQQGDFWHLVDSCRHENPASPRNEPCKFCNNVCSTWKKLSVHVGKHMEQIAMPTLKLAALKKVSPETIVSPVEPLPPRSFAHPDVDTAIQNLGPGDHFPHSPYSVGPHPYQGSSAGHSPAMLHPHPHVHSQHQGIPTSMPHQPFYNTDLTATVLQPMGVDPGHFNDGSVMGPNYHYDSYNNANEASFMAHQPQQPQQQQQQQQQQQGGYGQPAVASVLHASYPQAQIPRSQPLESRYDAVNLTTVPGVAYEPAPAPQHYYNNDTHDNVYMGNYGHDMTHARDGMGNGGHSGHASHSHTPGSTGHTDSNTAPYYNTQQPGSSSGQGYHY